MAKMTEEFFFYFSSYSLTSILVSCYSTFTHNSLHFCNFLCYYTLYVPLNFHYPFYILISPWSNLSFPEKSYSSQYFSFPPIFSVPLNPFLFLPIPFFSSKYLFFLLILHVLRSSDPLKPSSPPIVPFFPFSLPPLFHSFRLLSFLNIQLYPLVSSPSFPNGQLYSKERSSYIKFQFQFFYICYAQKYFFIYILLCFQSFLNWVCMPGRAQN